MLIRKATILIITSMLISGCSNSNPPLYDEVALIEYQSCLNSESEQWNLALNQGKIQSELRPGGKFWIQSENRAYQVEEFALSMCEKYRPKPIS